MEIFIRANVEKVQDVGLSEKDVKAARGESKQMGWLPVWLTSSHDDAHGLDRGAGPNTAFSVRWPERMNAITVFFLTSSAWVVRKLPTNNPRG